MMRGLLVGTLLVLACSSDDAAADRRTAPPPPAPSDDAAVEATGEPVVAELTVDMATPYFRTGVAGEAARQFRLQDWEAARDGFKKYLGAADGPATDADRARVRLLIAVCDAALGEWEAAADGFAFAAEHLPLVADYAHFHAARASYLARGYGAAVTHLDAIPTESRWDAEAQLLRGDLLRIGQQWARMVPHYEAYLKVYKLRASEAKFRLAQAYDRTGRAIPDALVLYRAIGIAHPLDGWADQARKRYAELLPSADAKLRAKLSVMTADEHIERGMVLYDAMRNPQSAAEFAAALKAPGLTPESKCVAAYHLANSWFKERNRTKAAPLFDDAIAACDATDDIDLQVKAAYQAGRSYTYLRKHELALKRFEHAERHKSHSYADDARKRRSEAYEELGDLAKVEELLASIPVDYPDGDMQAESLWRLAFIAWKNKDYARAIEWLDKQIAAVPIDTNWYGEGQAQYWKGRAYAKLGKKAESVAAYEECVRLYPLSYYSLLALNRLREDHPKRFEAVRAGLAADPPGYDPSVPAFAFQPRPLYASVEFRRGVEFLRLGLGDDAAAELARAGLRSPPGRDEVTDPDERDKIWALAFLFDGAGRYDQSHWVTRWHVLDYKRQWPVGANRARWRIAYPMAFTHLVERNAGKHGYPSALQMGIMREESAFDPLRESWANAIGLTQMIFPTAERFAKGTGIAPTRENLRDPEKNMTIGSNFLGFLHRTFEGRVGLMVPSYNAGEGATWRWMWQRKGWDWDEWEEEIPGDQARNYTKRVLASYFAYAYLNDGTIPELPQDIPVRLVPAHKRK